MNVNLGGDRIGSGNKMNIHLRHYERSTHNLSTGYKSSMGVGILYPCYCKPALRGDKFEIKVSTGCRTVPTRAAMFGTYKLQTDYYLCPVRLYTGILHNNPYDLGLKMNKVYFPQMEQRWLNTQTGVHKAGFSTSSLLHYLGLSGIGNVSDLGLYKRNFNALAPLAYYDIFKNYYSNKQEEYAYVLNNGNYISPKKINRVEYYDDNAGTTTDLTIIEENTLQTINTQPLLPDDLITFYGEGLSKTNIIVKMLPRDPDAQPATRTLQQAITQGYFSDETATSTEISILVNSEYSTLFDYAIFTFTIVDNPFPQDGLNLQPFELGNIDEMRAQLLSHHTMGVPYVINTFSKFPYSAIAAGSSVTDNPNVNSLQGLCIKTYQSDMFNAWLSSEYIDGVNGVANITKVSTEGGGFTIDALNFSEKMYNLLNRIIVSGGTYEAWQDVVYEETPKRHLESPMYIGGTSEEIVFEEIVANAATENSPLGSMGSRGVTRHRKGGTIRVKVDEASLIIGITSITPRIDYSQGNDFLFTDILTMDDFHKPALDGIGFQDLIGERMAYFDTALHLESGETKIERHAIGKLPAWIEYMTDVDKVHGDMADGDYSFMVLNRDYQLDEVNRCIKDATTYIEPNKYNDTFYYTARDSQNFWVQIHSQIIARRKMSGKQIPNV